MGYSTLPEYNFPVGETCEGGGDCLFEKRSKLQRRAMSFGLPMPSDTLRQVCIPEAEGKQESSFEDNSAEDRSTEFGSGSRSSPSTQKPFSQQS